MKVAAAYIRVSTDDQTEFSPDSQLKALKSYAEKNNILLAEEFIFSDEGISGRNTGKRPAFNKMISTAKSKPKPFDIILVWKYSRFARNREDSIVYKSMLKKFNIDVVSVSEDVGDNKMSVLFEAMIEAMDEYYSINLAEEVKRGMTEKAKRGGVLSIPAYGYTIKDNKYVPVPDEAIIIRKVFNDYIGGKGFLKIAGELNDMGIKTHRGNPIENRTVEYWLNNPVYIGKIRWNPTGALSRDYTAETAIVSDGSHEAIIDIDTWNTAQKMLSRRKERYRSYSRSSDKDLSHWLTGIVRCERCGAVCSYQGGYFGCSKRGKGLCAGTGYISAKKLESIILSTLSDILLSNAEPVISEAAVSERKDREEKTEISEFLIKKLEAKLERIREAYENGVDTLEEYKASKENITAEICRLKKEIDLYAADIHKENGKESPMRLMQLLRNDHIARVDKNKAAKAIFKEIVKGESDSIKCVFWE